MQNNFEIESRDSTIFALVHFTGDTSLTYNDLKKEHLEKGEPEIGFHFIIDPEGQILMGRHISKIGAHYPEFDESSIGVCVIGFREEMEDEQSVALTLLLEHLKNQFPEIERAKYIYKES